MEQGIALGTLPPTLAAVAQPGRHHATGASPPCSPPAGAPATVLTPCAAADPHDADFLAIQPNLSDGDIGILRGLFLKPGRR